MKDNPTKFPIMYPYVCPSTFLYMCQIPDKSLHIVPQTEGIVGLGILPFISLIPISHTCGVIAKPNQG